MTIHIFNNITRFYWIAGRVSVNILLLTIFK